MTSIIRVIATAVLAATAITVPGTAARSDTTHPSGIKLLSVHGPSNVYDPALADVRLQVTVMSFEPGTVVGLRLSNFPTSAHGRTFGAHVHVKPCAAEPDAAGPHYARPGPGSLADREIWLDFTVGHDGMAYAGAFRPWQIPAGAAASVVAHAEPTDPGTGAAGRRVFCTTVPFG